MSNKKKQTLVYIKDELDDIFEDDDSNEDTQYLITPEMRKNSEITLLKKDLLYI